MLKISSHTKLLVKGKFHGIFQSIKMINLSSKKKKITIRFDNSDISQNAEQKTKKSIV
jgi:hypothetical protein